MMIKNTRNIRKKNAEARKIHGHSLPASRQKTDWPVAISSGSALIHHNHNGSENHDLCGPVVFCCIGSIDLYRELFPDSAIAGSDWGCIAAEQIISWMDAGMQVVYFIFCDPAASNGLSATCLVGKQARQTLSRQQDLRADVHCRGLLNEIAGDSFQPPGSQGGSFPRYPLI